MENMQSVAVEARSLIRRTRFAALATLDRGEGTPFASLVAVATAGDCAPLLFLSALARHTRNLRADPRASLLVTDRPGDDPLAAARLTVSGTLVECEDSSALARYLARHPEARGYADFHDFRLYRLEPVAAHLIAGFGRIMSLARDHLLLDADVSRSIGAVEERVLASIASLPGGPKIIGVDAEGYEFTDDAGVGHRRFGVPVATEAELCVALRDQ